MKENLETGIRYNLLDDYASNLNHNEVCNTNVKPVKIFKSDDFPAPAKGVKIIKTSTIGQSNVPSPEGPMIAVNSPDLNRPEMPLSTVFFSERENDRKY